MNDTNDTNQTAKKASFFWERSTFIHIDTIDEKFYNGTIIEVCSDFLILKDRFVGEVPIFFNQIENIEPYKQPLGRDA